MPWSLPPAASTFAGDVDFMFWLILVITGIAFVIVEAGLLWFVWKYRARPGRQAHYTHGSTKAEVVWTAVPAVTVVVLGIMSNGIWVKVKGRNSVPPDAMEVAVHAKQFEWNVTYPGPDGTLATGDDFTVRNQLHLVVNRPVKAHLSSEDVIHSFFIPDFRIKQDAVPGMQIVAWFQPTRTGEFELACAELCGHGHYSMGARVFVHTQEDYDAWLAERAAAQEVTP
ncbi:MAG TPA: cytochrome c oxidase subunit II [Gemmatimonadales bacterium]|nr:cytochrome c oxidase subunit II [Gemmatimonadales bacterium]